jgi:hypothetical protein
VSASRRCALALVLLLAGLVALLLAPSVGVGVVAPVTGAVAAGRPDVVVARTHTHHLKTTTVSGDESTGTDTSPGASPSPCQLLQIISGCSPLGTATPTSTWRYTNSAGAVRIPPTATPHPATTAAPTPVDSPVPTDSTGDAGASSLTTATSASATGTAAPASAARAGGGGIGRLLLVGLAVLVVLGAAAGVAVLRLR